MKRTLLIFSILPALVAITGKLWIYYSGKQFNNLIALYAGILGMAVLFLCILFAIKHVRNSSAGNYLTLKQAMKTGILVSIVSALLIGIFTYFFLEYVNLEYITNSLELNRKGMEQEKIPAEEINEKLIALKENVLTPFRIATSTIGSTTLVGVFMSFIAATFLIKNPTENN